MNKIKRVGLFLLTVLAVAILLVAAIYIFFIGLSRNGLYISLIVGLCFFTTLAKLYRHLFRQKFGINLNADIIFVLAAPSVFWMWLGWIFGIWAAILFYSHFIGLIAYLMADILIWGIRTYIERREIREYVKNIKEE